MYGLGIDDIKDWQIRAIEDIRDKYLPDERWMHGRHIPMPRDTKRNAAGLFIRKSKKEDIVMLRQTWRKKILRFSV